MDTQNKTIECAVSITINEEIKNIRIRHKEELSEARIRVDEKTVEVKSQKLPSGAALHFEQDDAKVIVTIVKEDDQYIYDCFVNEVSVKDGMPWKMGKYEIPEILKWQPILEKGLGRYTLSETVKGAIVGLFIFLFLVVLKLIFQNFLQNINLIVYFLISIFSLAGFYALLSPSEFKAGAESVKQYKSYRGGKVKEEETVEETTVSNIEDNIE